MLRPFARGLREFCKSRSWLVGRMNHSENEIGFFLKSFRLKIQQTLTFYSGTDPAGRTGFVKSDICITKGIVWLTCSAGQMESAIEVFRFLCI